MIDVYLYQMPEFANPADVKLRPTTLVPEPEEEPTLPVSGGQPSRRRLEYGLVEYPQGRRELVFALVQKRQRFDAIVEEVLPAPEVIGEVLPVLDLLAEFEQKQEGFSAQVRQAGVFAQKRNRFVARMRLEDRITVMLGQGRQGFEAGLITRKLPTSRPPTWVSAILRDEAIRAETDDEEAILTILMASRR